MKLLVVEQFRRMEIQSILNEASEKMEYEKAAYLRDEIKRLEESLGIRV